MQQLQDAPTRVATDATPASPASAPASAGALLRLGVFLALFAGIIEALYHFVAYRFWHAWLPASPQIVWMTPVANLILIAGPVLLLSALTARWPRLLPRHVVAGCIGAFAGAMLVLLFPMIHRFAKLAVLAGITLQTARLYRLHATTADRWVRRGLAVALLVIVAAAAAVNTRWRWTEWQSLRQLGAAHDGAPNVLLFILDTVRAQNLSVYGYERSTTPELERLAARGTVFEQAYATTSWTLPSHASMFTGRYPHELSADWQRPLDRSHATLAEVLRDAGYETAGFVANVAYTTRQTGLDRGFIHYSDYPLTEIFRGSALSRRVYTHPRLRQLTGYYDNIIRKRAPRVNEDLLSWLSRREQTERPFFAFLNYMDAHEPYLPPDPFRTQFGGNDARDLTATKFATPFGGAYLPWRNRMSAAELQAEVNAYDGSIASIDAAMGVLLRELEARKLLGNTIIVVTADHGEHLGENQFFGHGATLLKQALHVPLLVVYPRRTPAAVRVATPVTLRDLPATILDLAGLAEGAALPGYSLTPLWSAERAVDVTPSPVLARISRGVRRRPEHGMSAIIADGMHYIRGDDGREQLYDLATDPAESSDLADDPDYAVASRRMHTAMQRALSRLQLVQPAVR